MDAAFLTVAVLAIAFAAALVALTFSTQRQNAALFDRLLAAQNPGALDEAVQASIKARAPVPTEKPRQVHPIDAAKEQGPWTEASAADLAHLYSASGRDV